MYDGYLLIFCIVTFTIAMALIFVLQPDEPKKLDKQGMVKYNDNDY